MEYKIDISSLDKIDEAAAQFVARWVTKSFRILR